MIVLCPTRGRPERAAALLASFRATATLASSRLVFVTDEDDPSDYSGLAAEQITLPPEETGGFVRATNGGARRLWGDTDILGVVGDDSLFRTPGWDALVTDALLSPGIVYGDDLIQGEHLPTVPFMSTIIPRALGWCALPACQHVFSDDAWKAIGNGLGALRYLPSVIIEHMHPIAGKAQMDPIYLRGGMDPEVFRTDQVAFEAWAAGPIEADLARVREAMA